MSVYHIHTSAPSASFMQEFYFQSAYASILQKNTDTGLSKKKKRTSIGLTYKIKLYNTIIKRKECDCSEVDGILLVLTNITNDLSFRILDQG